VRDAPVAPDVNSRQVNSAGGEHAGIASFGAEFLQAMQGPGHASNWLLVNARNSRTGHPIGVLGPQVGYYEPQVLMEMDIHGPGIDARGATFPGVGLYVLLGHGRDYAWSATTANSDNVDTFAEVLCKDAFHYRYKGKCRAMEKLERTNAWTPNGVDDSPPGSETLTAYRTVHGIVYARGKVRGRKVAFVTSRSTYRHEADSALFFRRMNDPRFMRGGVRSFRRATKVMNFGFNWAYLDSRDIAYQLTGWFPQRARGVSPDFPVLGTGQFDWKGYRPAKNLADFLPQRRIPHAVNPPYLVSWNNKQAPGWAAADDIYSYGPIQRQQMLADRVRLGTRGKRRMSLVQLVRAMEGPATEDLRGYRVLPLILKVMGRPPQKGKLRKAMLAMRRWHRRGAHRRDLNDDGRYENERAVTLMDAWWPLLVRAEFQPVLRKPAFEALETMLSVGDHTRGSPDAPAFFDGWWGYVSKDLRRVLGQRPPAWRRTYCGRGSAKRCRSALRRSLVRALKVTPEELYGRGACADDPAPDCFDRNRAVVASGITIGDYPFQNRPTFQQTVSVRRSVP
jgi:acyl-homoserine lactone acylase PvdQ